MPSLDLLVLALGSQVSSTPLWPGYVIIKVASCATFSLTINPLASSCVSNSSQIFGLFQSPEDVHGNNRP